VVSSTVIPGTFAYSFDTGWWVDMRYGTQNGSYPFPVYFTCQTQSNDIATFVAGHHGGYSFFGKMEQGGRTPFTRTATDVVNGVLSSNIYTEIKTPNLSFGTLNAKTMSRFGAEITDSASTTSTTVELSVTWSDNDYATYNAAVPLKYGASLNFPFITQLGAFRQRSFKVFYEGTAFLRWKSFVMDINKGQQ
jgi:hypothetical protein